MQTKPYIWVFVPILSILLAACATAVVSQENGDLSAGNQVTTDLSPTEEVVSTEEERAVSGTTEHSEADCEDPFEGTFPAFNTEGWKTNFCVHSVPYDEIFSGGPPRDGIPPLDSPRFEDVNSANDWIEDVEPVILFEIDGIARAYPLQIMTWHEIVNDNIADNPVVVTFCPLCNTALVFRRPIIDNETLTFGTSGNLRNSDLVMWDRQTESWWQQFNGQAIVGDLTGTQLEFLPASIISWSDFKARFPDSEVLSIETGFRRSYGRNPYTGYDNVDSFPFAFTGDLNDELPPMARVLGIQLENGLGIAVTLDLIQEELVLNETIGDTPITIFWKPGTASALDSSSIAGGRDVGATGVFLSEADGQVLAFQANEDGTFTDLETSSTWDILGKAISGPYNGTQLMALPHHDTFWFAWAAFVPDIEIKR